MTDHEAAAVRVVSGPDLVGEADHTAHPPGISTAGYASASAVVRERVLGAPQVLRWIQRSLGALLIGFAARLVVTDR